MDSSTVLSLSSPPTSFPSQTQLFSVAPTPSGPRLESMVRSQKDYFQRNFFLVSAPWALSSFSYRYQQSERSKMRADRLLPQLNNGMCFFANSSNCQLTFFKLRLCLIYHILSLYTISEMELDTLLYIDPHVINVTLLQLLEELVLIALDILLKSLT